VIERFRDPVLVWGDRLLSLGLVVGGQLAVWEFGWSLSNLALAVMVGGSTVPLFWRRRFPLGALAVVAAAVLSTFVLPIEDPGGEAGFFVWWALVLVVYSVAAHTELRRALLGGAIVGVPVLTEGAIDLVGGGDVSDVLSGWVVIAVAWAFGRWLRLRRWQTGALEDRAARLERERDEQARLAVAEERARIARELHDIVAHAISVMVVQTQAAQRVLEGEHASVRESLSAVETTGRQALVEMRRLLGMLRRQDRELALAPRPSLMHLGVLAQHVRDAGLAVELQIEGQPRPLSAGVEVSAYRIVQEALTNALKHAGPAKAVVAVRYRPRALEIEIKDDGRGAVGGTVDGHGLVGMRERAALVGGTIESGPSNGRGYVVRAVLPT
jgi:signal transduction histidine kinase